MTDLPYDTLSHGITCIDAHYIDAGMACFYLLESDGEYAVIETGTNHSLANLQQLMSAAAIDPQQVRYVIPTHVHLDHAGGAGAMLALFPAAQLVVHPRGARHMVDPERLVAGSIAVYGEETFCRLYGDIVAIDARRVREAADGDVVILGSRRLQLRHTEGHARHHFCVWDEFSGGWFSGDMFGLCYPWFRFGEAVFIAPSTTPTQFDPDAYLQSLQLLASYAPRRMFLTHYGEVGYSGERCELLASQVRDYCDMARRHAGDADGLEATLVEYSLRRLHEIAPCDEERARRWLGFDMRLNAQGLSHWLAASGA